jgi:putative component of membrane protein insertase Oxa1/YidC/SpoIIIJ protein YidD
MSIARTLLVAAIRGYKRHLSPHKGFACAHRVRFGGCSCSTLGLRAVSRYGAWRGLGVLRLRLGDCRLAAEEMRTRRFVPRQAQAGFIDCDVPCDASCVDGSCIDLSSCGLGDACATTDTACEILSCVEWLDCGDCGDWGSSTSTESRQLRRRRRRGEPATWQPGPGSAGQPPE